jgi:hypothetical protein
MVVWFRAGMKREGVVRRGAGPNVRVAHGRANNDLHASGHCRSCGAFGGIVVVERRSSDNINIRWPLKNDSQCDIKEEERLKTVLAWPSQRLDMVVCFGAGMKREEE